MSCTVTRQLICAFVFAYARSRFSHDTAQMIILQLKNFFLCRKHGLSYVDPTVNQWDQKLIPMHVSLREKCRLLLYVITSRTRGLCSMLEVGIY